MAAAAVAATPTLLDCIGAPQGSKLTVAIVARPACSPIPIIKERGRDKRRGQEAVRSTCVCVCVCECECECVCV